MLSASHVAEPLRDSEEPSLAAVSASERLTYVFAFSEKCGFGNGSLKSAAAVFTAGMQST